MPNLIRRLGPVVLTFFISALIGCETVVETESRIEVRKDGSTRIRSDSRSGMTNRYTDAIIPPSVDREFPKKIKSLRDINALLVGISNFDRGALPSPQHTIGASILESLLNRVAANSNETALRLKFMADLRLDLDNPGWGAEEVTRYLKLIGQSRVYEYSPVFTRKQGELWPIVQGEKITKRHLVDAMRKHAKSIQTGEFAIFYLATHGILGADGIRYALTADSDKNQAESMLSYAEAVKIYSEELGDGAAQRVLLIFDTCLAREDGDEPEEASTLNVPPTVIVVSAAAPGQYAYYWSQTAGLTLINSTLEIGPFRRKISARDLTYFRTISAVPVAFARALRMVERACEIDSQAAPPEITGRDFGELLAGVIEIVAKESPATELPKTQNAQYIESSVLKTLDSFYEMSMSESQVRSLRRRGAVFSTGCKG